MVRSKSLKNVGTVARDSLANERTFLAWLRTSIVCVTIGVALAQILRVASPEYRVEVFSYVIELRPADPRSLSMVKPVAVTCICLGMVVLVVGFSRFSYVESQLEKKQYPLAEYSAFIAFFTVTVISVLYVASAIVALS